MDVRRLATTRDRPSVLTALCPPAIASRATAALSALASLLSLTCSHLPLSLSLSSSLRLSVSRPIPSRCSLLTPSCFSVSLLYVHTLGHHPLAMFPSNGNDTPTAVIDALAETIRFSPLFTNQLPSSVPSMSRRYLGQPMEPARLVPLSLVYQKL